MKTYLRNIHAGKLLTLASIIIAITLWIFTDAEVEGTILALAGMFWLLEIYTLVIKICIKLQIGDGDPDPTPDV